VGVPCVADLPVGLGLSDHMHVFHLFSTTSSVALPSYSPLRMTRYVLQYLLNSSGPLSRSPLEAVAFLHTPLPAHSLDYAPTAPDLQIHFCSGLPVPGTAELCGYEKDRFDSLPHYGVSFVPCMLRPLSRGSVTLASSSPVVYPHIQHNFLTHPRDEAVLVEGMSLSRRLASARAFSGDGLQEIVDKAIPHPCPSPEYDRAYVQRYCLSTYHPVGTCRMGDPGAATTVVDPRGRVVGITGLRVADASIIPFVPSGNTNAACIMIGERVARMVLQDAAASL